MGQHCHRLAQDNPCCPPALPHQSHVVVVEGHEHALSRFDNQADLLDFLDQMADKMLSSHLHRPTTSQLACRKQLFSEDKPNSCNTRDQTSMRSVNKENQDSNLPHPQDLHFSPARLASPPSHSPTPLSHTPFSELTLRSHSQQAESPHPEHWQQFLKSMSRKKFLHSNQHNGSDTPIRAIPELPPMVGVGCAPQGRGEMRSENGDKLVGFFAGGKCEGRARWVGREGSVFEGDFKAGVAAGWGVLMGLSYRYEGEWKNNKPEGKGRIAYSDGSSYNGDFSEGLKHGVGILSQPGSIYEGQFYRDQFEGRGTLRCDNGETYDGQWRRGEREGKGETKWTNGDHYVGQFRSGRREGRGTMIYSNGEKYEGEWRNGMKQGEGTFASREGSVRGYWRRSQFISQFSPTPTPNPYA